MYKKIAICEYGLPYCFLKILIIMKLSFILLIATIFHANATVFAQKINLKLKEAPLNTVFYEFSKQTGYNIVVDASLSKKISAVSVDLKNVSLDQAIEKCFDGFEVDFVLNEEDKTVFIKEGVKRRSPVEESVTQQQITVTGTVRGENGEPLPAVSVAIKGTQTRTVTDINGEYKINVPNESSVLVFTYLGYSSQERTVGKDRVITLHMSKSVSELEEVVVNIGYGEVKRQDLTGSVSQVNVDDLKKAPVSTFDQALAGRVAGVQVSSGEDQPGKGMDIVIRGGNSLTQSNAPLYVIDGFALENANASAINPSDIKSITILKDASSTAIYGARGANGVIVIETNSGSNGRTSLTYDNYIGLQEVTRKMNLMNPYEYVNYQYEFDPQYTERTYFSDGKTLEDYRNEPAVDWQELLFRKGNVHNHNLSLAGGNSKSDFRVSGSILNNEGSVINSGFSRGTGRLYLSHHLNSKLRFVMTSSYAEDKSYGDQVSTASTSTQSYASYLMYRIWGYRPIAINGYEEFLDELIDEEANDTRVNPYVDYSNSLDENRNKSFSTNANISFKITNELEFKVRGGITNRQQEVSNFYNSSTARGNIRVPGNTKGVNGAVTYREWRGWINENTLTHIKKIGRNELTSLVGFTLQENSHKRYGLSAEQVPDENLGLAGMDQGIPGQVSAYTAKNALMSFLGRVNYNLQDKYLFTASLRTDGSSKFSKSNRWSTFPSAAFAWRLRNEKFMRNFFFIDDAKIRASYGITGNNRVGDYQRFSEMTVPYAAYYSFNNTTPSPGTRIWSYGNDDLKWESTRQIDLGLDLALFSNKVNLVVDFYNKITDDLLLRANVPNSSGYTSIYKNVGSLSNTGVEFTLGVNLLRKDDFSWSADFNISFNKNKIRSLAEEQNRILTPIAWGNYSAVSLYMAQIGGPSALFYGLIWDGVYNYDDFNLVNNKYVLRDDIATNGMNRSSIQPGDIKYVDVNNDGIINNSDNVVIGRALPIHFGGLNNNLSYKNFTLNVFFQWSYGNDIMNANRLYFEGNVDARTALNQYASYENRWTPENPESTLFRTKGQGPAGFYSSRTVEDGSYLRLKTLNLAYTIPQSMNSKLGSKSITFFVSGQNLFTWTNYSGMDPEVSVRNSALTPGFDYSAYPRGKTYTLGVKANF